MHLPGKITYREIDEMIATVDKNEDWKISYSEFRVSICIIKSEICIVLGYFHSDMYPEMQSKHRRNVLTKSSIVPGDL